MSQYPDGPRFSLEPSAPISEDVVGDRPRLIEIGMTAVFAACVLFALFRFVIGRVTGLATPWWGNAIGAVIMGLLHLWWKRAPERRGKVAVHVTALAATIALLIPSAYGMTASKWWLSLVGFSVHLMARRREARVWTLITILLIPFVALLEPYIVIHGAIGEPPIEVALSSFFYVLLLLGLTGAFRRVADRRALALSETAASLARANLVRTRFLAHMSHELRTPLHGVIAMTDLANTGEASPTVHEQVRAARQSAMVLLGLLNNILDVTRAEANGIELDSSELSVHETLGEVLRPIAAQAKARGLLFEASAEVGLPTMRLGDRVRLGQIVMNLASNALKFTSKGKIVIRLTADANDANRIVIEVADTGRGIAADKLEVIFEPFAQSRADDSQNQAGAGLGLSIVRELVRAMGGSVHVTSVLGKGSTFTVVIPMPVVEPHVEAPSDLLAFVATEPSASTGAHKKSLRVLVCEDDPVGQRVARAMLDLERHDATLVADGLLAWASLADREFDLLLTDVEMPGIDGLELTRRIRKRERETGRKHMPIIAATAHVGAADQHRLFAAGVDAHLPKPFTVAQLNAAITRAIEGPRGPDRRTPIPL